MEKAGVLVDDDIRELIREGRIVAAGAAAIDDLQIQPASLDLRLGFVVCVRGTSSNEQSLK